MAQFTTLVLTMFHFILPGAGLKYDAGRVEGPCPGLPMPPVFDHGRFGYGPEDNLSKTYPFSQADFSKMKFKGRSDTLIAMMQKLQRGEKVRIVVLGGSETMGMYCLQCERGHACGLAGKNCAWPARLQQYLRTAFPDGDVEMLNLAKGGITSRVFMASLGVLMYNLAPDIDMFILDTLVNDAYDSRGAAVAYEALIRALPKLAPGAAIVGLLAGCPGCVRHVQPSILEHYDLPRVDMVELVQEYGSDKVWRATDGKHPNWDGHQIMADVFANMLVQTWQRSCSAKVLLPMDIPEKTYNPPKQLSAVQYCACPLSMYSAVASSPKGQRMGSSEFFRDCHLTPIRPKVISGDWRRYEDVVGKPGWIATQNDSVIRFPVQFGREPLLTITYLRSYENIGVATFNMNNVSIHANGHWPSGWPNVSQGYAQWYLAKTGKFNRDDQAGWNVTANSTHDLEITNTGKFKIMEVLSC